jgi:hypothetical protein
MSDRVREWIIRTCFAVLAIWAVWAVFGDDLVLLVSPLAPVIK